MKTARQQQISLKRSRNPFNHGSPVKGEEFFGRQEIIDNILLFLRKENEYNFTVFGQRRIGKTSLLRKIQDVANKVNHTYPVYFNLQDKARAQLPQLLFEIATQITVALELKLEVQENDFIDSHASFNFKERFIPSVFKELRSEKGQLLLLFDEFDVLGEIEAIEGDSIVGAFAYKTFIPFIVSLLEEIQIKKYPLKSIFAVGRNYKDLDRQRFGEITKFGPQEEIANFTLEETKKLLQKSSDGIIPFEEEAINEIYMLTSGHPYFTQCLAASSFDAAEKNKQKSISREIVREEFIPTVKRFASGVIWVWDSLSANDQVILYLMALLKEEKRPITVDTIREKALSLNAAHDFENLRQILEKMVHFKIIRNDKRGEYDFYVEFIRKWIVREISEAEIKNLISSPPCP
ncbi:MAG: ATP-binding protein [Candidatus Aminicenantes bacterium]|nr:ATP-binding protein [Candidatus Aminicenantes bacterium]